ncbi:helix-turn-helix transcriptional regulator [Sulfobacillus harzensis]|uniref:HTH luxR-type domain-containing protein n=1 Tax=Sulfobacillus harzensis TaxID=2729629 RepID=A0A7Y0L798_9FIRM|nr:helix-turn-helix transcriptional regulator [Sulfobacillus harzensis]NMP24328.1 hypothetical protein [Sulfobacillus harzensis]
MGFRLLVLGLVVVFLVAAPRLLTPDLVVMLVGYGLLLMMAHVIWWKRSSLRSLMQCTIWVLDSVLACVMLIVFGRPNSAAPALLPALAYEEEAYWPGLGGMLGGIVADLVIILAWWVRKWALRPALSDSALLFWIGALTVLIAFPLGILAFRRGVNLTSGVYALSAQPGVSLAHNQTLSPREQEILVYLRSDASFAEIADALVVDVGTIKSHASRIYKKFGVHSRRELIDISNTRDQVP